MRQRNNNLKSIIKISSHSSHRGISLLLAITIMGGLLFVTSAATNLIWTVSKSSRSIGDSESAYFAALAAVERALYEYEKGSRSITSLPVASPLPTPGNAAATYTTSATIDNLAPSFTATLSADTNASLPISNSNRLNIDIPAGKTFFLNLSTLGVTYPSNVEVTLTTGNNIHVTTFAQGAQASQQLTTAGQTHNVMIPLSNNDAKIMVKNQGAATARIRLRPTGGTLPLGIVVTGNGKFRNTERKIEVAKPNWVFY